MHRCRFLLDREELHRSGHPPCHRLLPIDFGRDGLSVRIVSCGMQNESTGYSVISILDDSDSVSTGHFHFDEGECSVVKVKAGKYMAMVTNRTCPLAKLVSESGCLLSSAIPRTDSSIEWTVVGPSSTQIHRLAGMMASEGYVFTKLSSERFDHEAVLTPRQELYFTIAWESGYYDVPKALGLDQLADTLGCSKSSLNTTLRYAERNIFRFFMELDGFRKVRTCSRLPRYTSETNPFIVVRYPRCRTSGGNT